MSRVLWLVVSGLLIAVVAGGSPQTADARGGGKSQMGQGQHHRHQMVGNGQMGGQMKQGMPNGGKRAQMAIVKKMGLAKKK